MFCYKLFFKNTLYTNREFIINNILIGKIKKWAKQNTL